ncbi:MAG: hypothetical protein B6U76_09080 [Desulfurococcales archaeon ex4484_217_2]|nr:MAG: hypothetical protein B6U76_09080 [Desulfurococcales archaeon ex4484_217_2]
MFKTITVKVPSWVSEEEFRRIVEEVIVRLGGRVSVDELRRELNIRFEDLVEEVETFDVGCLEFKEKERLK